MRREDNSDSWVFGLAGVLFVVAVIVAMGFFICHFGDFGRNNGDGNNNQTPQQHAIVGTWDFSGAVMTVRNQSIGLDETVNIAPNDPNWWVPLRDAMGVTAWGQAGFNILEGTVFGGHMTFNADGSGSDNGDFITNENFSWRVEGGRLIVSVSAWEESFVFGVAGNTLTLTDDSYAPVVVVTMNFVRR